MADHVALPGSERPVAAGAQRLRDADPGERLQVTIALAGPPLPDVGAGETLSREQLEREHGADADTVRRVTEVLEALGLSVDGSRPGLTRSLRVSGTVAQMEAAFRPRLGVYSHPEQGEFRGREGALHVPAELEGLVTGVFGLDERRVARRRAGGAAREASVA